MPLGPRCQTRTLSVEAVRVNSHRFPTENGRSAPPERPDLDRPHLGHRVPRRDLDRLLEAAALEDVEAADDLLGLGERARR